MERIKILKHTDPQKLEVAFAEFMQAPGVNVESMQSQVTTNILGNRLYVLVISYSLLEKTPKESDPAEDILMDLIVLVTTLQRQRSITVGIDFNSKKDQEDFVRENNAVNQILKHLNHKYSLPIA